MCPLPAFKVKGFFYQKNLTDQNSFTMDDIFAPETVEMLIDQSQFLLKATCSQFLGCCTTICPQYVWRPKNGPMIYLKTDFDMKVFLHDQGTEFWFTGFNEFPYDIPFGIVEANSSNGIM